MLRQHRYLWLVLTVAVWNTLCFVLPDFLDSQTDGWKSAAIILLYVAALSVGQMAIASVLSLNRYVAAVSLPLYAGLGAVVAYYRVAFHAKLNPALIDAALHTNPAEAAGVISWQLILWFVFHLLVAFLWVHWRWRIGDISHPWVVLLVSIGIFAAWYWGNGRLHHSANQRYPLHVARSVCRYISLRRSVSLPRQVPELRSVCPPDSLDVVMIIGESTRADHLSLNGYPRQTCPRLSVRSNVVSLPSIFSPYTGTAESVPHILTPADSLSPGKAYTSCSFITCLASQGYTTAWITNQDYGRTYAPFIFEADTVIAPNASKTVYVYHPWYDLDLLAPLDGLMQQQNGTHRLYVFHSIGSHWYYNNHVPPQCERFRPVITNRVLTQNDPAAIVNSYDNTVVSMDLFVDSVISLFVSRNAIVFYLSDHGESLGENGNWLHAAGAEETKYPAALVWYSDKYEQTFPDRVAALKNNRTKHYRTDYLFYSLLSAAGMEATGNSPAFDIFSPE